MNGVVEKCDVLVVGGGPVGLITAYQLARFLPHAHIRIIDKDKKSPENQYGRAITLYPRTAEMLDQMGLAEDLAQECFACRSTVSYDKDGNEVAGRGWNFMESMKDTRWNFSLVLRQKYQERIFRQALSQHGVSLECPVTLTSISVDETVPAGDYRITAGLQNCDSGVETSVQCRYLVGADGGRSFVRNATGIPFDGSSSEDKWVRIDGLVDTDIPKPRTYCSIESPTHGNVLWAALDHGATRIGYAFTAERQSGYEAFDETAAAKEAIEAVKPFSLNFKTVDWWTIYVVGQRIARHFFVNDCIFLAGDACHTHSSGAAQGMNTGIHDAVNLAWKLALVLQGAPKELLHSYEKERLPNVEKLIKYDKDISRLMTMQLPENWSGDPNADPNEILGTVMADAAPFSSGLGIYYEPDNVLNQTIQPGQEFNPSVKPGQRAPDVALRKPGTFETTHLITQTPNVGKFYICVFTGDPSHTLSSLKELHAGMAASRMPDTVARHVAGLTIIGKNGPSAYEVVGDATFGKIMFDHPDQSAHSRYGVPMDQGAVYILRPDGWVGFVCELGAGAVMQIQMYFERFLVN